MQENKIVQTIRGHIENKMILTIERKQLDNNEGITGFPLILSDSLMMLLKIVDFRNEGFLIIRMEDITDAYSKKSDAFFEKICIKEGLTEETLENPIIDLTDFICVFKQLFNYNKFITVQCEEEDNELFYSIGKISKIEANGIHFKNFDKMGVWEDDERIIPINKISSVSFNDHYSNMYYKYMKPAFL